MRGRILIVDDDRSMCDLLDAGLRTREFQPSLALSADEALRRLAQEEFDAVVTDLAMPGTSGIDLCSRITTNRPDIPVILITAFGTLDTAVAAIRAGAYDFVTKPFETDGLAMILDRAVQLRALREEVKRLRQTIAESQADPELIGQSPALARLLGLVVRIADSDASVLIVGETGTGKELIARALHRRSRRSERPFIAVNCAAVPEQLLESELFGHARGAFTDAKAARKGLFMQADRGTLFLDEIGDMPLGVQAKLLRALQERRIRPIGSDTEVEVDARVVAATNCDLESAVAANTFREDLYFRINVIQVDAPPLRARGNDVLILAQHFIQQFAQRSGKRVLGLSSAAAQKLLAYSWPGNVRELQNCIERAIALTGFEQITVDDLPGKIREHRKTETLLVSDHPSELVPMDEVERRYIERVLSAVGGNKSLAAQILGFDRKTLYRKLERYQAEQGAREKGE